MSAPGKDTDQPEHPPSLTQLWLANHSLECEGSSNRKSRLI